MASSTARWGRDLGVGVTSLLVVLGPFAPPPVASAAPASLIVTSSDVSQLLTYGRFDPSLGLLTGLQVTLTPPATALPTIRMPGPRAVAAGGAVDLNEFLKEGGPPSSTIFERLRRPVPLCGGGVRSRCADGIDFADMPMPVQTALRLPRDLPPPVIIGAAPPVVEAERLFESYLCPIHVPATFSCATATDPAPVHEAVAETLNERAPAAGSASDDDDDDALLGIGLLIVGFAIAVMGAGLVVYRKAARSRRRRSRYF